MYAARERAFAELKLRILGSDLIRYSFGCFQAIFVSEVDVEMTDRTAHTGGDIVLYRGALYVVFDDMAGDIGRQPVFFRYREFEFRPDKEIEQERVFVNEVIAVE